MPGQSGYAVGWGSLALINAGLAQGKGRGGLPWFLISLLAGPFATLAIVLLPPLPEGAAGPAARRPWRRNEWLLYGGLALGVAILIVLFLAAPPFMRPML